MGAIVIDAGRVLLVRRSRDPHQGWWSLPGGAVETGETLQEAIRREVREETGLDVAPLRIAKIFERITRDATGRTEYHYVLIDYLCTVSSGSLAAADDAAEVSWFALDALPELLTEGAAEVIAEAVGR